MTTQIKTSGPTTRPSRKALALSIVALAGAALTGCNTPDSYFDPSITGRWEDTPTTMPILRNIASIEPDDSEFVTVTEVRAEDLRPLVTEYRLVPGDSLVVTIFNYPVQNQDTPFDARVEDNGTIELPRIGKFYVLGATSDEVRDIVVDGLIKQDLIRQPSVTVFITGRSEQQFSLIGSVRAPGPYFIPQPSYRLLDALAAAGGIIDPSVAEIFVIRQVALADDFSDIGSPASRTPVDPRTGRTRNGNGNTDESSDRLIRLIDELNEDGGSPSIMGDASSISSVSAPAIQPENDRQPEVDLIDDPSQPDPQDASPFDDPRSQWIFIDGRWVQTRDRSGNVERQLRQRADAELSAENLVTQRIISIPVTPLLDGDARKNIIIRPGDIIRVPQRSGGTVYLSGQVNRPGAFDVAPQLTLTRVIAAAGGLGGLAIPDRVDLTRMVGTDRQATIMLDLDAIAQGHQPDIFIKPNDHINIGTSFWAYPLAVARGGFRVSYGFGFLLDRNFGNDVFGAPPRDGNF